MKKNIANIQYITQDSSYLSHAGQARLMFEKGIQWVQIRMKKAAREEILQQAKEALSYAKQYKASLIINDAIEIAKEIGAHGVHLGLNDVPVDEARKYLGEDFTIGGTANTIEDVLLQISRGADYIGLGPFRPTTTKKNLSPVIGLKGCQNICNQLSELNRTIPIVAVGGIQLNDIEAIQASGIHGVAISGALLQTITQQTTKE